MEPSGVSAMSRAFPSGTIIGSDISRGLFVWTLEQIPLTFTFPDGLPEMLPPLGAQIVVQIIDDAGDPIDVSTATLHSDDGGGLVNTPLNHLGGGLFTADFPDLDCGGTISYYFSAETIGGSTARAPRIAPALTYDAIVANGLLETLDDFELDQGWTTTSQGATTGFWDPW